MNPALVRHDPGRRDARLGAHCSGLGRVGARATALDPRDLRSGPQWSRIRNLGDRDGCGHSEIGELSYRGERLVADGRNGPLTRKIRDALAAIRYGQAADPRGWMVTV